MNLEQLTKTQIILLTLLVSFVTSIATGIVTVSLIDQAPPAVTQTINRVVERTVERVVSTEGEEQEVVTREVQVIVKENDLIPTAVAKVEKSIVRLYTATGEGGKGVFLGLGLLVSNDGLVATDASLIAPSVTYVAEMSDGTAYTARFKNGNVQRATVLLEITSVSDGVFSAATIASPSTVQLGQTVLTVSGRERNKVLTGIISDITFEAGGAPDVGKIQMFITDIPDSAVFPGSPLVDVFGSVVGMYTVQSAGSTEAAYTPSARIESQLQEVAQQ